MTMEGFPYHGFPTRANTSHGLETRGTGKCSVRLSHIEVPVIRRVPRLRVARLVALDVEAVADDRAALVERLDPPHRHRLHEDIADARGLVRPGYDGAGAGVGGHLVDNLVAPA